MSEPEQFEPARPRRRSPWPARLLALFFVLLGLIAAIAAVRAIAEAYAFGAVVYLICALGAFSYVIRASRARR